MDTGDALDVDVEGASDKRPKFTEPEATDEACCGGLTLVWTEPSSNRVYIEKKIRSISLITYKKFHIRSKGQ